MESSHRVDRKPAAISGNSAIQCVHIMHIAQFLERINVLQQVAFHVQGRSF